MRRVSLLWAIALLFMAAIMSASLPAPAEAAPGCMFAGTLYPQNAQVCQAGLLYLCTNTGTTLNPDFVWESMVPQQNC